MKVTSSECTVVMATYNGENYLTEQLDSLERQTVPPVRLVISDDGSSDATREILESYAKRSAFDVAIVDGPQQGYAENFWSAARLADTTYVAWADQDDVWHPRKIEKCVRALEASEADFVSHAAAVVDGGLRPLGRSLPGHNVTRVLEPAEGNPFASAPGLAAVFKRTLLGEVDWAGRPLSHMHMREVGHDQAVELIAYAFHRRVELAESLANYRQHACNAQGDPSVTGLARMVRTALSVSADDYARFSSRAQGYADYIAKLSTPDSPAVRSFEAVAERARYRAEIRTGRNLAVRMRALIASVAAGTYRSMDEGGFGAPALLNDSLSSVIAGLNLIGRTGEGAGGVSG